MDKYKKSDVYKLNCGSYPEVYLGGTFRKFSVRYSQHEFRQI